MDELLPEVLGVLASLIITFLLLKYEFRKSRELDIYYQTFESLVQLVPEIESLFTSLQMNFLELHNVNCQLLKSENEDYILIRHLGNDLNCLDFYVDTYEEALHIIEKIHTLSKTISYLSFNFKQSSDSKKMLDNIVVGINDFIEIHYRKVLNNLNFVRSERVIIPENFLNIFPVETSHLDGEEIEMLNLVDSSFHIENFEKILQHFNRNNFS
ncbi:MAG: hypothetical protein RR565_04835 [Erysipelothrix sp.]